MEVQKQTYSRALKNIYYEKKENISEANAVLHCNCSVLAAKNYEKFL